jgi:hypothetical protein
MTVQNALQVLGTNLYKRSKLQSYFLNTLYNILLRMTDTLSSQNIHRSPGTPCMQTYPAETGDKWTQITQKGAYVGTTPFAVLIATLHA